MYYREGKDFLDDDEQQLIRSKERNKIADLSKDNTTPEIT